MGKQVERVACIGECMVELGMPGPCRMSGHVDFAGDSFNTAVYLKRCAPETQVAYVTALGTDSVSNQMLARFESERLDTSLIERRSNRVPGVYAISVDSAGERSFTYWRDRSAARSLFEPPSSITPEALSEFDLVYLSGISVAILSEVARQDLLAFLGGFRAAGRLVAFDSNYRPQLWTSVEEARRVISAFWSVTDIGLPSMDDEQALFGDCSLEGVLARLSKMGIRRGALKQGAEGPIPLGAAGPLPRFRAATHVVDTTAAGDSFNGAYLAAFARNMSTEDCLLAGHELAARVIGMPGAILPMSPG